MPRTKQVSKRKRGAKAAVPVFGAAGLTLSLAGGASAAAVPAADTPTTPNLSPNITLGEEELSDVSLATFYVFDKENAGKPQLGEKLAWGCRCGCRRCGCGFRRCAGCGCGGCCASWGRCRWC
jgi:hypothetical protein